MRSTNRRYWRLQAWTWALIVSLRAERVKNEPRLLQLAQNNGSFEISVHSERPGSQMAPWGITWGSYGDCKSWSDCEIGTGAGKGSKCKHTQRKWVTIPTLVLAHCGSPRILEADAKSWPLCAFGSLCEQTNVTMTVFGWVLLWPPCLKGLDAGSACLQLGLGLSLGSQYQADIHHCVLRWKRVPGAQRVLHGQESCRMGFSYSYYPLNCQCVVKEGSRAHVKVGREKGWAMQLLLLLQTEGAACGGYREAILGDRWDNSYFWGKGGAIRNRKIWVPNRFFFFSKLAASISMLLGAWPHC